jgi:4-diphosphocytidyl-2-C-methyl-D-erythritol kinase
LEIKTKAYAKLNISLDVVAKRRDGYHDLLMVMQSVQLCDYLTVRCSPGEGAAVITNLPFLPEDGRNTAAQAARLFFEHTGIAGYMTRINIIKRIPVCAGLGGGSADAAAVLRGLNKMFDAGLDADELIRIGAKVGSDVPFCVVNGTVLAKGRGERLTSLPAMPDCDIVICKPAVSFSTPKLFAAIKCERIRFRPDTNGIVEALGAGDLKGVARRMYNVFEDVAKPYGAISEIKGAMLDHGALGAVMTGTGSAVFGLFDAERKARSAYNTLRRDYSECFLTRTLNASGKPELSSRGLWI